MTAVAERKTPAGKASLSRDINKAIDLDARIKELTEQLKETKNRIWDQVGEPGLYRSNKGHVEIKQGTVLTVPTSAQADLENILGDRYPDLVDEVIGLKAKSGLRRLIFEPGPTERDLSEKLKAIVKVREQVTFTLKGAE